ncbi:MAG: endonuclease III domain-containing protein [Nanoarchaeota archaeon]|nr:endonuclease III domain-containing protein [Nanoarchaeota archaeon]
MAQIKEIYKLLQKAHGKQGWWPIINNKTLLCEYHGKAPRNDEERFEIIIGCILTQNTSWTNVEKALYNLNKAKLLDIKKINKTKESEIASLIKPSGYFNQKANRLKIIAMHLLRRPELLKEDNLREELLKIKGIGPETADSIILYSAEKPSFVIDAYTKRIFSRLGFIDENSKYDEIKAYFENNLEKDVKIFKEYHALIVEHAKRHCKTKPECKGCILRSNCNFASEKQTNQPVKNKVKPPNRSKLRGIPIPSRNKNQKSSL